MTSFQRVAAALSHQEADHVPVYPILCGINRKLVDATYEKWATDAETCAAGFLKTAELFDLDCLVTLIDLSIECDAWGQKLIFPENEAPHPDYSDPVIREIEDYAKMMGGDLKAMRESMRPMAETTVRSNILLSQIVDEEKLSVTDEEIEEELKKMAEQYQMELDKVKELVKKESVEADLAAKKAVKLIVDNAVAVEKKEEKKPAAKRTTKKAAEKAEGEDEAAEKKPAKRTSKKAAEKAEEKTEE